MKNFISQGKDYMSREIIIWLLAIGSGMIFAMLISGAVGFIGITRTYAINVQNEIADNVIRFHVIANSNSLQDQALKDIIRDEILDRYGGKLDPQSDIADTRIFIQENLDNIQKYAASLIEKRGFNYPVYAVLDRAFFPTRTYGNMSFPAGKYEALRIIIGSGAGSNWWCVMFPPLCYVDAAIPTAVAPATPAPPIATASAASTPQSDSYTVLWHLLSDDAYSLINHSQRNTSVTIRFKIVEWWQEWIHQSDNHPSNESNTFAITR